MKFSSLVLDGCWLIEPEPHSDERGLFARTWCVREFAERGLSASFVQASTSYNELAGTLRGMHHQLEPHSETKLVRCTAGAIYDVAVDVRPNSATYLKWIAEVLSADNRRALYIPPGFAHGFVTLEEKSEVLYELSEFHHPESARGLRWNDPAIGIQWPREPVRISERDANYALLSPVVPP